MDIIKQLSNDAFGGEGEDINSFFTYRKSQLDSVSVPSLEAGLVGGFLKKLTQTFAARKLGNYTPHYIKPISTEKDWLTVGEIVIESPVTFRSPTTSTFFGQLDKARPIILALEDNVDKFIQNLGRYISDPSLLASVSGTKEVIDAKDIEIKSLDAVKRMVDVDSASRVKLSRLFTSISDMNAAVKLSNSVNETLAKVDMDHLVKRVDRIVELMEILEKDAAELPSKNSINSLMKDTQKLALGLSELAYVITAVDNVSLMMEEVSKSV